MKTLETEILQNILDCEDFLGDIETQRYVQADNLLEELSNKFCVRLPTELQAGFKALMNISFMLRCESRNIGKVMGLKIMYEMFGILQKPKTTFEHLAQTWPTFAEMNADDIKDINTSIANYLESQKEAAK